MTRPSGILGVGAPELPRIELDLKRHAIPHNQNFEIEDLLTGVHYQWRDRSNYVALRPDVMPAHIFRFVKQSRHTETKAALDYFIDRQVANGEWKLPASLDPRA